MVENFKKPRNHWYEREGNPKTKDSIKYTFTFFLTKINYLFTRDKNNSHI